MLEGPINKPVDDKIIQNIHAQIDAQIADLAKEAKLLSSRAASKSAADQIFYETFFKCLQLTYCVKDIWKIRFDVKLKRYYFYEDNLWQEKEIEYMNTMIFDWGSKVNYELSTARINTIHLYLQSALKIENDQWNNSPQYLNMKNGIIDLYTNTLLPHSPEFLITQRIDANFTDSPGDTPYIDQVRKEYTDAFLMFERFVQAILRYDLHNEMALYLTGPTGSGKGTVLNLLFKLMKSVSQHASIKTLGDVNYGFYSVLNKRCLFDKDSRTYSYDQTTIENFLKMTGLDTCDGQYINGKWMRQFSANIKTFIICATNQFARLPPGTDMLAFFRRILIIPFDKIQKSDPDFKENILLDLDNWVSELILIPYHRWKTPFFDTKGWATAQCTTWDYSANPIKRYVREMFERTNSIIDTIQQDDVLDWIRQRMTDDTYQIPNDLFLKQWVTSEMAGIRVRKKRQKYEEFYFPVRVKALFEGYCEKGEALPPPAQNTQTNLASFFIDASLTAEKKENPEEEPKPQAT